MTSFQFPVVSQQSAEGKILSTSTIIKNKVNILNFLSNK